MNLADVTLIFEGQLGGSIQTDLTKVKQQLEELTEKTYTIKGLTLDTSQIDAQIKSIKADLASLSGGSASIGGNILKGTNTSTATRTIKQQSAELKTQKTLLDSMASSAKKLYSSLNSNPVKDAARQVKLLSDLQAHLNNINNARNTINAGKLLSPENIAFLQRWTQDLYSLVAVLREEEEAANAAAKANDKLASAASKAAQKEINKQVKDSERAIEKYEKKYGKLNIGTIGENDVAVQRYLSNLERVKTLTEQTRNLSPTDPNYIQKISALKAATDSLGQSYDALASKVKSVGAEQKRSASEAKAMAKQMASTQNQIQGILEKNQRLSGTVYGSRLQGIQKDIQSRLDLGKTLSPNELKNYQAQIQSITAAAMNAGKMGKSMGQSIAAMFTKFGGWMLVTHSLMRVIHTMREMVGTVTQLDTAMTQLKRVTNETDSTYNKFFEQAEKRAVRVGATLTDTINASADFVKLGYNIEEAAGLADAALIYKNVGIGITDISEASGSIVSSMKAFNINADEAINIVDKYNDVGNKYAITSQGIGEALQRSASALAAGGNTIDESIALITAGNEIVQDPQKMGTTLKTISMYLRAAKTEAQDAGEDTEGMAESVSKLRAEIMALTGNRVDIMLDKDNFKSTYQILKELSEVWDDLTDVSQANLLERLSGKRNANVTAAIIKNFSQAEAALKTSQEAAGSATRENERYLQSIEGRISQFKAVWEGFSNTMISSDFLKNTVTGTTKLVSLIDAIASKIGSLPTLIGAITAGLGAYRLRQGGRVGILDFVTNEKGELQNIRLFNNDLKDLGKTMKEVYSTYYGQKGVGGTKVGAGIKTFGGVLGAGLLDRKGEIREYKDALSAYNKANTQLRNVIKSNESLTESTSGRIAIQNYKDASRAMTEYNAKMQISNSLWAQYYKNTDEGSRSTAGFIKQMGSVKNVFTSIGQSISKVGYNLASMFGSAFLSAGIMLAVSAAISGIAKLITHQETVRKKALESADAYNKSQQSISDYAAEVATLKTSLESGNLSIEETISARERLSAIQNELIQSYGTEAQGLNLITTSATEAADAMDRLAEAEAKRYLNDPENQKGFKQAVQEMEAQRKRTVANLGADAEGNAVPDTTIQELKNIAEEYEAISMGTHGNLFDIKVTADPREAAKQIDAFIASAESKGIDLTAIYDERGSSMMERLLSLRNADLAKEAEFGKQYDSIVDSQIKSMDQFRTVQNEITEARTAYNKALVDSYDSDEARAKAISGAINQLYEAQSKVQSVDFEGFSGVQTSLNRQIDEAISAVGKEEFKADLELNVNTKSLDEAKRLYRQDLQEISDIGANLNKTTYGNIDLQNRQRLEWTQDNVNKYRKALESWGQAADEYLGSFSTVDASSANFDGVEIAFTPMLQTEHGAEYLDKNTVMNYIGGLLKAASAGDGKWTADEVFKLDAQGLMVDGKQIKGLIADIGETAIQTGESMHFIGKDGSLQANIDNIKESFDALYDSAPDKMKNVLDVLRQFQTESGEIKLSDVLNAQAMNPGAWEALSAAAKDYGVSIEYMLSKLAEANIIQSDTNELAFNAAERFSELSSSTTAITDQQSALNTALQEQASNGTITLDTYNALIATSKDFANTLEFEAGAMKINGEMAQNLIEAKTKEQVAEMQLAKSEAIERYKQNAKAIEEAERSTRRLTDAEREKRDANLARWKSENETIMDTVNKYNILIDQLQRATGAYAQWQNAKQTENSDSIYKNLVSAKKDIDDALKSGQTGKGNDDYTAAIKLLVPEGKDVKEYRDKVLNRYLQLDDDGGLKFDGLNNFLNDAIAKGLMYEESDGAVKVAANKMLQDFIDEMEITPELAKSIFDALETYDFEFDFSDEEFLDAQSIDMAKRRVSEYQDQLDGLRENYEEIQNNKDLTPEARTEQLDEVQQKIDEISTEKIITEVQADTAGLSEGEAALEAILRKQEEIDGLKSKPGVDPSEIEQAERELALLQQYIDNLSEEEIKLTVSGLKENIDTSIKTMDSYIEGSDSWNEARDNLSRYIQMLDMLPDEVKTEYGISAEYEESLRAVLEGRLTPKELILKVKVEAEIDKAKDLVTRAGEAIKAAMSNIGGVNSDAQGTITVDADTGPAETKIATLGKSHVTVDVEANITQAQAQIASLQAEQAVNILVTADPYLAQAQINSLQATPVIVNVTANTTVAEAQIAALAARLAGSNPTVTVNYSPDTSALPTTFPSLSRTVNYVANTSNLPTSFTPITRTVRYVSTGDTSGGNSGRGPHDVNGTANALGTALAGGNWGAKTGGMTLVGELGRKHFATLHSDVQTKNLFNCWDALRAI